MTAVAVVTSGCAGCGACLLTCPERAIRPGHAAWQAGAGPARLIVLEERCTGCGDCAEVCPADAIALAGAAGRSREGEEW